jgi:glutathione S-transferase
MKVYDIEGFPNPARVRMALAEKKVTPTVEFIIVDVLGGEHRQPSFLETHPDGVVPVLELPCGTTISECTAITEYIDNKFDGISLTGNTPKNRAKIHMMNRKAESKLLDAVGSYFHHATEGLGPDLEIYQNKDWGLKQKEVALKGMKYFNEVLKKQKYIAGEEFSMADITVFAGLSFADFAKIKVSSELKNLSSWRERIATRASIKDK